MNLLAMARKEFNVDERRTYLMGHSMGGAGTLYLGSKYASTKCQCRHRTGSAPQGIAHG